MRLPTVYHIYMDISSVRACANLERSPISFYAKEMRRGKARASAAALSTVSTGAAAWARPFHTILPQIQQEILALWSQYPRARNPGDRAGQAELCGRARCGNWVSTAAASHAEERRDLRLESGGTRDRKAARDRPGILAICMPSILAICAHGIFAIWQGLESGGESRHNGGR